MNIPQHIIEETMQRYKERTPERSSNIERIETGPLLEVDTRERVNRRLERLVRVPQPSEQLAIDGAAPRAIVDQPVGAEPLRIAMERVIGTSDLLSINYLELGIIAARAVGRVQIGVETGFIEGYGTGVLVAPRLLLTNNHVLSTFEQAAASRVEFNYQYSAENSATRSVVFALDPDALFITNTQLDYTLVAVREQAADGSALQAFGWKRMIEEEGKVLLGEYVSIIQHPNGEPKQLALRENQLIDLLPDFLHYRTDTAPGSSGSPIFNDQWEIVGLHHSGVPKRDADGNILSRDGKIWTQDMGEHQIDWAANEGIRISRIAKHIRQQPLASDQQALRDTIFAAAADELLPAPPAPVQQNSATPQNGNMPVTSATGAVTWTIPLQISINLGAPSMNAAASPAPAASPVAAPARQPLSQPAEDSAELRDDLAEARRARTRPYYDAAVDQRDRTAYYSGLNDTVSPSQLFKSLSELVQRTHTTQLRYQPRSHVYPWVDLHPNGKLRSIYSGQDVEPEAFIREDVRIDQQRERLRASSQELVRLETTLAQAQNLELINLLEASLPYNCEHVVPQSWFDKREPMRGDLHHLFACESGCNSFRGNVAYFDFQDFGEAVRSKCGKALKESNQFEPENGKGAVARATLYFLLRYPGAINQNDQEYRVERLTTLLQWHVQFPVTDYERHRNMAIFQKQGNRNPLIDFPQLAERIDFKKGLGR